MPLSDVPEWLFPTAILNSEGAVGLDEGQPTYTVWVESVGCQIGDPDSLIQEGEIRVTYRPIRIREQQVHGEVIWSVGRPSTSPLTVFLSLIQAPIVAGLTRQLRPPNVVLDASLVWSEEVGNLEENLSGNWIFPKDLEDIRIGLLVSYLWCITKAEHGPYSEQKRRVRDLLKKRLGLGSMTMSPYEQTWKELEDLLKKPEPSPPGPRTRFERDPPV
jgi:hypothetical protein